MAVDLLLIGLAALQTAAAPAPPTEVGALVVAPPAVLPPQSRVALRISEPVVDGTPYANAWTKVPTIEQIHPLVLRAENAPAMTLSVSCRASADGSLTGCAATGEAPKRSDLSDQVAAVVQSYRLLDVLPNNKPVAGQTVTVSVELMGPLKPIQDVRWIKTPTPDELEKAYPVGAAVYGLRSKVVMDCTVSDSGTLKDCAISSERPAGRGFGDAVLSLAPKFLISRTDPNGGSTAGARVSIPIVFSPKDQLVVPAPPPFQGGVEGSGGRGGHATP